MTKRMLIDALHPEETRVVIADEKQIYDFDFVSSSKKQLKGNIYLAKITRVEPSLQAAFVEYGGGKQGFLPFSEIHPDYYQIPMSDRRRLMEEVAAENTQDDTGNEATPAPEGQTEASTVEPVTELPAAAEEQAHPAYLMEGAIDVSTSSEELPEEHAPIQANDLANAETGEITALPAPTGEATETAEASHEIKAEEAPAGENNEGVETLPSEEEDIRPKKNNFSRRYKIQEVIRRGQIVLVQVIKEERGNKGCSLTTYLSLAGRYCVLMPNSPKDGGISRKIMSPEDRKRLKAITNELRLANGMSVIIRTAGMDRTRAEIKRDYDYLVKVWNSIRDTTLTSTAPALIYEESNLIKRAIRDQYTADIEELVIEGDEGYQAAKEFMKLLMASHTPKIKMYDEPTPLFYAYNVEDQLLSMHDPIVKLRSGGYIVINPTEALISIDVNSGRATGERNIEETAVKTNIEAAQEVARQLRLRDLAGLIVIDFIDMLESRNRRAVERTLKDALKADRAKIQLGRISPFGLLEMSRQRLRPSISETNMVQCPHCVGRGYIRSNESMSIQLIRAIEKEASTGNWGALKLVTPQEVALHMLNTKRDILRVIEERYGISIIIAIDAKLATSEFNLEKMRRGQSERNDRGERGDRNKGRRNDRPRDESAPAPVTDTSIEMPEELPEMAEETSDEDETAREPREGNFRPDGERRSRGGRRRRGRRGGANRGERGDRFNENRNQQQGDQEATGEAGNDNFAAPAEASESQEGAPEGENNGQRQPRNRGGRGRRRWRERGERREQSGNPSSNEPREASAPTPEPQKPQEIQREHHSSDAKALPAFATEKAVPVPPPPPPQPMRVAAAGMESTPRDPSAPTKKGWWQKIIELDD